MSRYGLTSFSNRSVTHNPRKLRRMTALVNLSAFTTSSTATEELSSSSTSGSGDDNDLIGCKTPSILQQPDRDASHSSMRVVSAIVCNADRD